MDWFIGKRKGRVEKDAVASEAVDPSSQNGQQIASSQSTSQEPAVPVTNDLISDEVLPFLVKLPSGLDEKEWLSTNTIPFFNNANVLHSAVSEFCTSSSCPSMCIAPNWPLYWIDDKGKKKKCSACKYGDLALSFIQKQINDETLFPTKRGIPFPAHFESVLRRIYRFLFQILAHAYTVHVRQLSVANLGPQLTCVFKHLIMFSLEFHLLDIKEMEPVSDLVRRLSQLSGCAVSTYQPVLANGNNNSNTINALNINTNSNSSDASSNSSLTLSSTATTSLLPNSGVANNSSSSPATPLTHLQLQPVA